MLERHGIVTRETAIAEGIPGGFASIYGELQNLELLGNRPARLLRRGARRGAVRAAGCGRAAAEPPAHRREPADPGRDRPREPLRRDPPLAEAGEPAPPGSHRERLRRAARRGAAALRRARRPRHPAPRAARGRGAGRDARGARRGRSRRRDREARDRAPRRRAGDRHAPRSRRWSTPASAASPGAWSPRGARNGGGRHDQAPRRSLRAGDGGRSGCRCGCPGRRRPEGRAADARRSRAARRRVTRQASAAPVLR